jgi:hypothetical protein
MELLACSVDGTVAYLQFTPEELGTPLTLEEKVIHRFYSKKKLTYPDPYIQTGFFLGRRSEKR